LLSAINGMFAFAILDRRRRKLILARDAFGVKPLYLRRGPGQISFASEIRALEHDGLGRPSPDPVFVSSYLHIGWVPSPRTAFAGVTKLLPGTVLEIDLDTGVEVSRVFYRLIPETLESGLDDETLLERFRQRLNWVVRRQLISDVPIGVFLSGGLDSSAILTVATSHLDKAPRSFSVGFRGGRGSDETAAAGVIAKSVGSHHTIFSLDATTLEDLGPIQSALEEPIADSAIVPLWHLCRGTAEHVKVALSGEGGDEALGGYTRYFWGYAASALSGMRGLSKGFGAIPRVPPRSHGLLNIARRAGKFVETVGLPEAQRYLSWFQLFSSEDRSRLAGATVDVVTPRVQQLNDDARAAGLDVVQAMQMVDMSTMLVDNLLVKADKLSMAHGLEVRVPLLDRKLVEFGLALPIGAKIGIRGNKPLLRRMLAERLPPSITQKGKRGFELPVDRWFRDEGTAGVRERLSTGALVRGLGFSPVPIKDLVRRHLSGDDLGRQMFALAWLEAWAELHC
ncbi:MAG: asparagine synthase (glutamine-hydrolyzing), partial [Deltaproteobacteria bacterium]|nr:asparagine synthase (glutamine-hydrolyzing) [Deltaproteobacteria bacterium]